MANTNAIVNKFNADQATVTETIRKGKYRVFNGNDYDIVHLETSADQVIENDEKKFVSLREKSTWNNKADANHKHDQDYAKIGVSYTKEETNNLLNDKANSQHTHLASNIKEDTNHKFVTDADKAKWNDTYTTAQVDSRVKAVNDYVASLESTNATAHSSIIKGYQDADKELESKVTTVQGNLEKEVTRLTDLINTGGDANTALASKVANIENVTIPGIRTQISGIDSKFLGITNTLSTNKADRTQVTSEITAAKNVLQTNINAKADKSYVDTELGKKANASDVYNKEDMNTSLLLKADKNYVDTELGKKVSTTSFNSALSKKANTSDVETALAKKANTSDVETALAAKAEKVHTHTSSQITGLGDVATKNVGTQKGNIPILNDEGKLESSILPAIAINESFTADNQTEAMKKVMQIGDILVLTSTARDVAIQLQKQGEAITYQVAKSRKHQELSDEYTTYLASGRMTYLCVDPTANTFEDRFKPLQSSGDTISKAEVNTALASKVSTTVFDSYKSQVVNDLSLKADRSTTYTKTDVDNALNKKVTKENGKQLSTNDFTHALKTKLDAIDEGANKYVHPNGDSYLHVPATGTTNNGKVLMAGLTAGSLSWKALTTENVSDVATKRYVTDEQIAKWNAKAESNHAHTQYRLISNSLSTAETKAAINKLKTIVSVDMPSSNEHVEGAVWIEIV